MSAPWSMRPIQQPDSVAAEEAARRQETLTKPPGSLGELETLAIRLAGLQRRSRPAVERVTIAVFAGDHGVAANGVSAFPQAVTAEMVRNFARGGAAISVLARQLGAALEVVDLGTVGDTSEVEGVTHIGLGAGTADFTVAPAMTTAQLDAALDAGRAAVGDADLFIGGEMGIGNTTSAAAVVCALLQLPPSRLAGPGTGLDATGVRRKVEIISQGLARHDIRPDVVTRQPLGDDLDLAPHACRIQPGARSGEPGWRQLQQGADHRRGGSGVADSHLAADEEVGIAHGGATGVQRRIQLRRGHGGRDGKIGGTGAKPDMGDALHLRGIPHRAQIDHLERRAELPRQHADGRAATGEIAHHLGRHRLRESGYAIRRDAMIASEDGNRDPFDGGARTPLQPGEPDRQRLQFAERAGGLGQRLLPPRRLFRGNAVRLLNGAHRPGRAHIGSPFRIWGRPAMVWITRSQRAATS